ncbi:zinc-binding dehydrogenase [Sorangium sp. So ce260]|uniref:zinc-binding dehydrogenase n=1 Tax=Sorangium sp. So ce260 TaxID=3133291 RepID=UPI003F601CE0
MSAEREVDMLALFIRALRKHGAPDALYLYNGSTHRGHPLHLACERLGTTLIHARPYDAPARGKVERSWRTLRERCVDFTGAPVAMFESLNRAVTISRMKPVVDKVLAFVEARAAYDHLASAKHFGKVVIRA